MERAIDPDVLWNTLARSVPFHIAVFALDGTLVSVNTIQEGERGLTERRKKITDLFPLVPDAAALIDRVLKADRPIEVELAVAFPVGTRTIATHLAPIVESGRATGVLAVGIDVTESKQASIELRMSVNALHRLLEEREQVAADLHDGILQSLYGVGLRLEAARVAGQSGLGPDQHIDRAIEQLNGTMAEIRRFLDTGRASLAAEVGWEETLTGVLRSLSAEGGPEIAIELSPSAAARVATSDRGDIIFIAREAVSNAVRHGHAGRVLVRLSGDGQAVRLEVEDDGRGLSSDGPVPGLGLLTMTRRAGRMGAALTIQSTPGRGTKVQLDVAVRKELAP